MFIIAGLGNPDEKYQGTRHNVGFDVVDRLAEKYQIPLYLFSAGASLTHRKRSDRGTESASCEAADLYEPEWREYP